MKLRTPLLALAVSLLAVPVLADNPSMPYSGQQARTIKALSDEDIAALRKGEGMGMAKAAELNGYPGPVHVLALAGQLGLTKAQRRDVQAIFDRMSAAAKPLGGELIAQEQALDQLFAKGDITPDRLAAMTLPLPTCKVGSGRCICRRISKLVRCSTPIRSPVMRSFGAMAIRTPRHSITTAVRTLGRRRASPKFKAHELLRSRLLRTSPPRPRLPIPR